MSAHAHAGSHAVHDSHDAHASHGHAGHHHHDDAAAWNNRMIGVLLLEAIMSVAKTLPPQATLSLGEVLLWGIFSMMTLSRKFSIVAALAFVGLQAASAFALVSPEAGQIAMQIATWIVFVVFVLRTVKAYGSFGGNAAAVTAFSFLLLQITVLAYSATQVTTRFGDIANGNVTLGMIAALVYLVSSHRIYAH